VRGTRIPDELKIVFDEDTPAKLSSYLAPRTSHLEASSYLYLQPCDTGDPIRNKRIVALCVDYIKSHPEWRLSLQTHKLIDIE
jgi:organic radical activating enzyme